MEKGLGMSKATINLKVNLCKVGNLYGENYFEYKSNGEW